MNDQQALLNEFRKRLESLAEMAVHQRPHLARMDVAGTFIAIGATLITRELGADKAVEYLRELSNEYELAKRAETGPVN